MPKENVEVHPGDQEAADEARVERARAGAGSGTGGSGWRCATRRPRTPPSARPRRRPSRAPAPTSTRGPVASTIAYIVLISETVTSSEPAQSTPWASPLGAEPGSLLPSGGSPPSERITQVRGREGGDADRQVDELLQRQLRASVRRPPASRPSQPPATDTNTYAPIARARSASAGNSVTMIARITEAWAAAPTPWSRRAPIMRALRGAPGRTGETPA